MPRYPDLQSREPQTAPTDGQLVVFNNTTGLWVPVSLSGDATMTNTGALTLAASGVTAGTVADIATRPRITVDTKGRVTAATKHIDYTEAWMNGSN